MHLGFVEITLNSFHFHGTCLFSPIISSITLCKRPFYLLKKSNISLGLQLILCPTTERISTEFARASLKNCEIMDPTHVNYTLCSDQKLHFTSYSEISKCYWGGGGGGHIAVSLLLLQLPSLLVETSHYSHLVAIYSEQMSLDILCTELLKVMGTGLSKMLLGRS